MRFIKLLPKAYRLLSYFRVILLLDFLLYAARMVALFGVQGNRKSPIACLAKTSGGRLTVIS
jgi:hypothetical protein